MKTLLAVLALCPLCLFAGPTNAPAVAATNAAPRVVVHPAWAEYKALTNQLAFLNRQLVATNDVFAQERQRLKLQSQARTVSREQVSQMHRAMSVRQATVQKQFDIAINRIRLRLHDLNTAYGFDKLPKANK